MNLLARNILVNAVYYVITLVGGPFVVLQIEKLAGIPRFPFAVLTWIAVLGAVTGILVQVWAIVHLHRVGHGTPSPVASTTNLVSTGPYAFVRNPLNIGEVLVFLALAAWFGSLGLLAYALAAWVAFHVFILRHEEPRHAREFGDAFAHYRAEVGRWLSKRKNRNHPGTISCAKPKSYIAKDENGEPAIKLLNQPSYCHGLRFAPDSMEVPLRSGAWLVMNFAIWSGPDIQAIQVALRAAKSFNGRIKLGIRPFDCHDELRRWCPPVKENCASPVWLLLKDGQLIHELACIRSEQEIAGEILKAFDRFHETRTN